MSNGGSSSGEQTLLKLSEVRKITGVDVDVLRLLIDDGELDGVVRGRAGHAYVAADRLPTWHQVVELVHRQRRHHLDKAAVHMRRVEIEVEAVKNDLELAIDEPAAELGHDLLTFRSYSRTDETTLASALRALEDCVWRVKRYDEAARSLRALGQHQVD